MTLYQQQVARYYNVWVKSKVFQLVDLILRRNKASKPIEQGKLALNWEVYIRSWTPYDQEYTNWKPTVAPRSHGLGFRQSLDVLPIRCNCSHNNNKCLFHAIRPLLIYKVRIPIGIGLQKVPKAHIQSEN